MQPANASALSTANHFTLLLYNFRHGLSGAGRGASLSALSGRWSHWWRRLDEDGELARSLDDIYFYLPHVHRVVFPESLHLPAGTGQSRVEAARRLSEQPLDEIGSICTPETTLRLTLNRERLAEFQHMELNYLRERFSSPFKVLWVDVLLFPFQIGVLILKVQLEETAPSVARINDFHYYVRTIHPPKLGWELATVRFGRGETGVPFKVSDLVDYLLQGLTEQPGPQSTSLKVALDDFSRTGDVGRYTVESFGQVYGETLNVYHYSCLAGSEARNEPSAPFESVAERSLYELATCTDSADPTYRPHASYVATLMKRHRIAIWENWQGLALHDNVAFLGLSEGPFTTRDLPHNVESDYFYLYLTYFP
jgi:hypothetical protein